MPQKADNTVQQPAEMTTQQSGKTLILAEKPSVAREIAPLVGANQRRDGYLEGKTHIVSWALGHLVNIAEPEEQNEAWRGRWDLAQLPMIPARFALMVLPNSRKQFEIVQALMLRSDVGDIVNATDAGREGELIFRRIYLQAGCDKPIRRLWANDMTEEGLRASLQGLLSAESKRNLGLAAFARAEADWLVGMNFSRLLTLKARTFMSIGRVQTPVLKLLCDRRHEVEHFTPKDFWTVEGDFSCAVKGAKGGKNTEAAPSADAASTSENASANVESVSSDISSGSNASSDSASLVSFAQFHAVWHEAPDYKETRIYFASHAHAIVAECLGEQHGASDNRIENGTRKGTRTGAEKSANTCGALQGHAPQDYIPRFPHAASCVVDTVERRKGSQQAPLPFDLTTLQREANTRFGYAAKDTLEVAQALYERHKLITYPRTDSRYLTKALFAEILKLFRAIYALYPAESVEAVKRVQGGGKFACIDDANVTDHHALIPTARKAVREALSAEEWNVYDMICRRFMAAFLPAASFASTTVRVRVMPPAALGENGGLRQESKRVTAAQGAEATASGNAQDDGTHIFIARGKTFNDIGWLRVEPWRSAEDAVLPPLKKGQRLTIEGMECITRQTKAPAHFTDASLLAAMETAGKFVEDDDLRAALKERGLGTPATRAQVIETLISRRYIERQGKKLVASNAGMRVIAVADALLPHMVSPELTGQWEKKLKDIELLDVKRPSNAAQRKKNAQASAAQAQGENTTHSQAQERTGCAGANETSSLTDGVRADATGGAVVDEGAERYKAFMRAIRAIVAKEVENIRNRNVTQLLIECTAKLAEREFDGKCPLCGAEVEEREKMFGCSHWKQGDGGCPFVLWKEAFGIQLDAELVRQLLSTGHSEEVLTLTSRAGKEFQARLKIEAGRLAPEFLPRTAPLPVPQNSGDDFGRDMGATFAFQSAPTDMADIPFSPDEYV